MSEESKGALGKGAGATVAALVLALGWFITPHEAVVLRTYPDPVHGPKLPTACMGETGPHIRMGQTFTLEQCTEMMRARHVRLVAAVGKCVHKPVAAHEAVALLSMADNLGAGAVCGSTMVRQLNGGMPATIWCEQIPRWRFAGGRDCWIKANNCGGIVKRRAHERSMCLGDVALPGFAPDFTPVTLK